MTGSENKTRILSVEDDDVDHMVFDRALSSCGLNVSLDRALTLENAKEALQASSYSCLFLDHHLPDGSGLDLLKSGFLSAIKNEIAVIMLTGEEDVSIAVEAIKCGASDYLPKKRVAPDTLAIAIAKALESKALTKQVREAQARIAELAYVDSLTGLPNRYVFEDRLDQLVRIGKREKQTFLVGMLDLNGFKGINDNLGHQAGDVVLQAVAGRVSEAVRDSDTAARFGGDEFALLLPKTDSVYGAEIFSKRILDAIKAPILIDNKEISVGVSIGLSEFPKHGKEGEALIKKADVAMYAAKKNNLGWSFSDK